MNVSDSDRRVVEKLFRAMQAGAAGEQDMMELFSDDAVFVEPFSGKPKTHSGKEAIRASFREMWRDPAPEMTLSLERVDVDGDRVRADWICSSPVFSAPMAGYDIFTLRSDQIVRLEVVVTALPPMGDER